jgi:hypothetical protein
LAVDHSPGDELFDLDPSAFVAARDRLAKELKAAGDAEGAAAVKALRRPSVGAWALNRVARTQPGLVAAVVEAGRALAAALEAGDRAGLRRATSARREAVRVAARAAVDLAGEAHRDDIVATLDALATDDAAAAEVVGGRLTRGLSPGAVFAPLGDVSLDEPAAGAVPPAGAIDPARIVAAETRAEQALRAVTTARQVLADAVAEAEEATAELERLRGGD